MQAFANASGFDLNELLALNRGYLRWATPPESKHHLLIPTTDTARLASIRNVIAALPQLRFRSHEVERGDTIGALARRYGVSVPSIRQANNLQNNTIRLGKTLVIPLRGTEQSTSTNLAHRTTRESQKEGQQRHQVMSGETLWSIAKRYQVSVSELLQWNKLNADSPLQLDQILLILD